ncbi:MAG: hypothetical protein Q8N31_10680 [Reyranella sp.]|nr:hypothetical protein [Reyranella sp.]MDP3160472.1 hypothetical protein [Reyranella sp.]
MVHDAAVYFAAAWLGNAWDLFFSQFPTRALSTFIEFGPIWGLRNIMQLSPDVFILLGHALYFAGPLLLWLVLRAVEPDRVYSRLYLATVLVMVYFISEMVAGLGLWLIWFALQADPVRPQRIKIIATVVMAPLLALTHPGVGLFSILLAVIGGVLLLLGRPFPRNLAIAAGLMGALLIAGYLATAGSFGPTNPAIKLYFNLHKYDYVDPNRLLAAVIIFPMLAAYWLLLIAPGLESAQPRWRLSPHFTLIVAIIGAWFAAGGTGLLTWLYGRHIAPHALALSLALALCSPAVWLAAAKRPLILCAAISAIAAVSYNVDLFLFGRYVDRHQRPGLIDVTTLKDPRWPPPLADRGGARTYFKWVAGDDYVRDVVLPEYDWYRVELAFYSFFRSNRQGVLFHPLGASGEWLPFECAPVSRVWPRDEADRIFVAFLAERYCAR